MNKKIFISIICSVFMLGLSSCNKFKSEVRPLKDEYATFTAQDANTGKILIGIKTINYDKVIIPAGNYTDFDVDDGLIIAKAEEGISVFNNNGNNLFQKQLSSFEKIDAGLYILTDKNGKFLHFKDSCKTINIKNYCIREKYLLIETDTNWQVYQLNGAEGFKFPQNSVFIHSLSPVIKDEYVIAIPKKDKKGNQNHEIYTIDGQKKIFYTQWRWKKLEKNFKNIQKIGSLTVVDIEY